MKTQLHRTLLASACLLACPMLMVSQETAAQESSVTLASKSSVPAPPTKSSQPMPVEKLAIGMGEVKQLLLLMDTDKNGKVSKQEFMKFMNAEFERLDINKNGDLDVKELTKSKVRVSHFASVGK
jgi:hypothetical protein